MQVVIALIEVANAKINSLLPTEQQANEQPSDEPIFVTLPATALQDLLGAIQSLKAEVQDLKAIITSLEAKVADLELTQDTQGENELNMLRLINDLRKKDPGKTEITRAEKIEKYLQSRPDHKATFETLKGHLGIDKFRLNEAIKTLMTSSPGGYGITHTLGDRRKRTLVMLPK